MVDENQKVEAVVARFHGHLHHGRFQPDRSPGNAIPTPEPGAAACFAVGFFWVASQLPR